MHIKYFLYKEHVVYRMYYIVFFSNMEQIVALSQEIESDPAKIILLEHHINEYLSQHNSDQHHHNVGYGNKIKRFRIAGKTPTETFHHLEHYYWVLCRRTASVKRMMDDARKQMESQCNHVWERDWEDRDERSRYVCKFCNKGR